MWFLGLNHQGHSREESNTLAVLLGRRVAKAVMADGMHFGREDMTQITAHELDSFKLAWAHAIAIVAVFPEEGDMVFADLGDAAVGDGGSCDVGAQVFDGA